MNWRPGRHGDKRSVAGTQAVDRPAVQLRGYGHGLGVRRTPRPKLTIDLGDLRPGVTVRVGLGACDRVHRTFFLDIESRGEVLADGRVWLTGYRLGSTGRHVEAMSICVPLDKLYPTYAD